MLDVFWMRMTVFQKKLTGQGFLEVLITLCILSVSVIGLYQLQQSALKIMNSAYEQSFSQR